MQGKQLIAVIYSSAISWANLVFDVAIPLKSTVLLTSNVLFFKHWRQKKVFYVHFKGIYSVLLQILTVWSSHAFLPISKAQIAVVFVFSLTLCLGLLAYV